MCPWSDAMTARPTPASASLRTACTRFSITVFITVRARKLPPSPNRSMSWERTTIELCRADLLLEVLSAEGEQVAELEVDRRRVASGEVLLAGL